MPQGFCLGPMDDTIYPKTWNPGLPLISPGTDKAGQVSVTQAIRYWNRGYYQSRLCQRPAASIHMAILRLSVLAAPGQGSQGSIRGAFLVGRGPYSTPRADVYEANHSGIVPESPWPLGCHVPGDTSLAYITARYASAIAAYLWRGMDSGYPPRALLPVNGRGSRIRAVGCTCWSKVRPWDNCCRLATHDWSETEDHLYINVLMYPRHDCCILVHT